MTGTSGTAKPLPQIVDPRTYIGSGRCPLCGDVVRPDISAKLGPFDVHPWCRENYLIWTRRELHRQRLKGRRVS